MAHSVDLVAEMLELLRAHADDEVAVAVAVRGVGNASALEIAAAGADQLGDRRLARHIVKRLKLDIRAIDHLRVVRKAAFLRGRKLGLRLRLLVGLRRLRIAHGVKPSHVKAAAHGEIVVRSGAVGRLAPAAGEQRQEQRRRKQAQCAFP